MILDLGLEVGETSLVKKEDNHSRKRTVCIKEQERTCLTRKCKDFCRAGVRQMGAVPGQRFQSP